MNERSWIATFYEFTAYMRARGHMRTFVMFGRELRVPGLVGDGIYRLRGANGNQAGWLA